MNFLISYNNTEISWKILSKLVIKSLMRNILKIPSHIGRQKICKPWLWWRVHNQVLPYSLADHLTNLRSKVLDENHVNGLCDKFASPLEGVCGCFILTNKFNKTIPNINHFNKQITNAPSLDHLLEPFFCQHLLWSLSQY